jgi:hypothetical protein
MNTASISATANIASAASPTNLSMPAATLLAG